MKVFRLLAIAAGLAVRGLDPAAAFEPMEGCFVADAACGALASIKKETNPGGIATEIGRTYRLRGANRREPSHFQILIPGADPQGRWVEVACGRIAPVCEPREPTPGDPVRREAASFPDNVLAASWQPAFCERHRHVPECRSQTAERFDASHFALHGLWPQPRDNVYCGVSERDEIADEAGLWDRLPAVRLDAATRAELEQAMPGTRSHLERHEWLKHGTCYSETAAEYYRESLQLMDELNASAVRELFARRIGRHLRLDEVRAAFDVAFGPGAGDRAWMVCEDGLIVELRLQLMGEITPATTLADLLAAAAPAPEGCAGGRVDAAGFRP